MASPVEEESTKAALMVAAFVLCLAMIAMASIFLRWALGVCRWLVLDAWASL